MVSAQTLHAIKRAIQLIECEWRQAEERAEARSNYGANVYERAMINDIRVDAKILGEHLLSICSHPDAYYAPPDDDEDLCARCELCLKVWPKGTSRDADRVFGEGSV